ncbi:sialidase family protein [Actinacidiphila sp. ITFR-21]|uniref:sialidase family protein n=1 Tax=Actinacidiphila sp. ITFR-21 TaxID=3075199 RepID=UPI002889DE50|nr:sialidase family protein [Streptomyces sp. ITFR-21]WNI16900.1 sialidase family protein [Streptomyces sp. ITFR-21]
MRLRARATLAAALPLLAALTTIPAATAAPATATACTSTLWASGTGGYAAYRIPAVVTARGTLVAFAEGRKNSAADGGDVEILERRSTDGGCTWTPQQVVADDWYDTIDCPTPMVTDDGTIVLVFDRQGGSVTQPEIEAGTVSAQDARRVFVQTSDDAGVTWSARREITTSVKAAGWRWMNTGPGHGVTIQYGRAKGRLVAPADHTAPGLRGIQTLISDDDGQTWRTGDTDDHSATDDPVRPGETSIAELPDARLYVLSRNVGGQSLTPPLGRGYTYSLTSGSSFSAPVRPAPQVPAPEVEGSLLQDPGYPQGVTCAPLLYTAPEDPLVRRHLTLRRSDDGGITWRTISDITGPDTFAAYSDMAKTDRVHVGIAYETWDAVGAPSRIDWQRITLGCP